MIALQLLFITTFALPFNFLSSTVFSYLISQNDSILCGIGVFLTKTKSPMPDPSFPNTVVNLNKYSIRKILCAVRKMRC